VPADSKEPKVARIAAIGGWFVRGLGRTWRFEALNDDVVKRLRAARQPVIFALWHGEMLPLLYYHRGEGVAVLISEHGDGELIARVAMSYGYRTVRGSTSRGAARALLGLVRELEEGHDLAITPDGPRGPAKSFAPGTVIVAQRGRAPIIPVVAHAEHAWRLKSWDRFMIPKPFSRVTIAYGDPLTIDVATGRSELADEQAESVRARMLALEAVARA
jgi:lysophospholipid acyltransferase (LPLAT)-like uncharacterized protein